MLQAPDMRECYPRQHEPWIDEGERCRELETPTGKRMKNDTARATQDLAATRHSLRHHHTAGQFTVGKCVPAADTSSTFSLKAGDLKHAQKP